MPMLEMLATSTAVFNLQCLYAVKPVALQSAVLFAIDFRHL